MSYPRGNLRENGNPGHRVVMGYPLQQLLFANISYLVSCLYMFRWLAVCFAVQKLFSLVSPIRLFLPLLALCLGAL